MLNHQITGMERQRERERRGGGGKDRERASKRDEVGRGVVMGVGVCEMSVLMSHALIRVPLTPDPIGHAHQQGESNIQSTRQHR